MAPDPITAVADFQLVPIAAADPYIAGCGGTGSGPAAMGAGLGVSPDRAVAATGEHAIAIAAGGLRFADAGFAAYAGTRFTALIAFFQ